MMRYILPNIKKRNRKNKYKPEPLDSLMTYAACIDTITKNGPPIMIDQGDLKEHCVLLDQIFTGTLKLTKAQLQSGIPTEVLRRILINWGAEFKDLVGFQTSELSKAVYAIMKRTQNLKSQDYEAVDKEFKKDLWKFSGLYTTIFSDLS